MIESNEHLFNVHSHGTDVFFMSMADSTRVFLQGAHLDSLGSIGA